MEKAEESEACYVIQFRSNSGLTRSKYPSKDAAFSTVTPVNESGGLQRGGGNTGSGKTGDNNDVDMASASMNSCQEQEHNDSSTGLKSR